MIQSSTLSSLSQDGGTGVGLVLLDISLVHPAGCFQTGDLCTLLLRSMWAKKNVVQPALVVFCTICTVTLMFCRLRQLLLVYRV